MVPNGISLSHVPSFLSLISIQTIKGYILIFLKDMLEHRNVHFGVCQLPSMPGIS